MRATPILVVLLLLTACAPPSEASVEAAANDLSGVVMVDAWFEEGDDDIPWEPQPPWIVDVQMEQDVSADQVSAVFDAYADAIGDEDVALVRMVLDGPKQVSAEIGGSLPGSRAVAEDLVAAQHDDEVLRFEAGGMAHIVLRPVSLDRVVEAADRYPTASYVSVEAGEYRVIRDDHAGDPALFAARRALALEVSERFDLLGAVVPSDSQLELVVPESQEQAVRALALERGAEIGVFVVRGAR